MIKLPNTQFYLCGGCVRDYLLGRPNKDRDYVVITPLSFQDLCSEMEKVGAEVFLAKEEFLTIRARYEKEVFDVAYPRIEENYSDKRHPDHVSKSHSLYEDSCRRDFTINSMYVDDNGQVLDFHFGQLDLHQKRIKAVRDPHERFSEDYLRILRAIRFSCVLNFGIETETYKAMKDLSPYLSEVVADRIREELNKALIAAPRLVFLFLEAFKLFPVLEKKGISFEVTSRNR